MIEVQILIPVAGNDGVAFAREFDEVFEAKLVELFGGMSLSPHLITGAWIDDGTLYHDQTRIYTVALSSLAKGHLIGEAVEFAKVHYNQLAIYVRYLGLSEIL